MRVIPFEIVFDYKHFSIALLHFDWWDNDAYLFYFGIDFDRFYQKSVLEGDLLFGSYLIRKYQDWKDNQ